MVQNYYNDLLNRELQFFIRKPKGRKFYFSYDLIYKQGSFFQIGDHSFTELYCRKKMCYKNSLDICLLHPHKYRYVEGFAFSDENLPLMEHAWLINEKGDVIDPTWNEGVAYKGIVFPTEYVLKKVREYESYGILNFYRKYSDLLKHGIEILDQYS